MKSLQNQFLIVKQSVVLTPSIDVVIAALDEEFRKAGHMAFVTSGLRDALSQLRIIRNELRERGLDQEYPGVYAHPTAKVFYPPMAKDIYAWQLGWSKLLNLGFVVNPPFAAECLMDYVRPGSTENRKGKIIHESPHFDGTAFDIGGGKDGVANEAMIIQNSMGKVEGLKGYLIERNNNAVHVDCLKIE